MHRALLRLSVAGGLPPLVRHLPEGTVLAPFGRWLRERVASAIPEWPTIGFHRIEITDDGIELLLVLQDDRRAAARIEAVLRRVRHDTARAAIRCGWTRGPLWRDATILSGR